MKKVFFLFLVLFVAIQARGARILIPMDQAQKNHLKAYGIAYFALEKSLDVEWLLNYRGGSFLLNDIPLLEKECAIRGITIQIIAEGQAAAIITEISNPEVNMDIVKLEKAPKIAVYSPKTSRIDR